MKMILEFNSLEDALAAVQGQAALSALRSIKEELRSRLKYGNLTPEITEELERMRDLINTVCEEIRWDDL